MTESSPLGAVTSRSALLGRLYLVTVLNILLGLVVSQGLMTDIPAGTTMLGWIALGLAWLSTLSSFMAILLLLCIIPVLLLPRRWLIVICTIGGFGLLQIALYSDTVVYRLFRLHYNPMIWELLTSPATGDSVTLGRGTVIAFTFVVIGIVLAEFAITWLALHHKAERFARPRWLISMLVVGIMVIAADKVLYAWGDLAGQTNITRIARRFPFYQPVTIHRFAVRRGWVKAGDDAIAVGSGSSELAYPRTEVALPADPSRLNIVILAVEGCRFDMLDPVVMPRLHAFAQTHTWGRNHFSGGNATRFGIFSLLYGIHSTYWHQVVAERQGPFLIQVLKKLGYRITVQACTDLNFAKFRQTAFVDVPETITDQWPDLARVDRDRIMTDNLVQAISDAGAEPFFSFGFYDASHANYIYPPEHALFSPVQTEHDMDFLSIAKNSTVENLLPLYNRYRNSLNYVDAQIGRILDELVQRNVLDRTLVFVVGDHGEEFGELGTFGHNGTFNRYQIQTLMVANIPGKTPGAIDRLTSHIDIVPTILAALGITAPASDYSNGQRLDQPSDRDHVISVSWDSLALIDAETTTVRGIGSNQVTNDLFDHEYRPLTDTESLRAARRTRLLGLIQSLRQFSK